MPFQVLSAIDIDSDGMIKVDHVVKVLELLGNEEGKLSPKQIRHIVDMLSHQLLWYFLLSSYERRLLNLSSLILGVEESNKMES